MRPVLAALTGVLGVTALARADISVRSVTPADAATPRYAVSSRGRSLVDTVAAVRQQTGLDVKPPAARRFNVGGPVVVYDLEFQDLPRDAALRALADTVSMGLAQADGGGLRLDPGAPAHAVPTPGPAAGVRIVMVTRRQTVPASKARPDAVEVQFNLTGRPPAGPPPRLEVTEAVDDRGRSLLPAQGRAEAVEGFFINGDGVSVLTAYLPAPAPMPARIATLRGTYGVAAPTRVTRVTATDFADARQTAVLDGARVSIGPTTTDATGVTLPIVVERADMDPARWQTLRRRAGRIADAFRPGPGVEVRGVDGSPLMLQPRQSTGGADKVELLVRVVPLFRPEAFAQFLKAQGGPAAAREPAPASGPAVRPNPGVRPAYWHWDAVEEETPAPLAFEFKNVDVP